MGNVFKHVQGHISGAFRPRLVPSGGATATAAYSPIALFAAGEQGAWYDPNDFASLFQDDAGTTPVTAAGQSVGKMLDKSGNGNHVTEATNKPTLRLDSITNRYYLEFDGTNDKLTSASLNLSAYDKCSIWCVSQHNPVTAVERTILQFGDPVTTTASFNFGYRYGGFILWRTASGSFGAREVTASTTGGAVNVAFTDCNLAGTTHATENPQFRVNGASPSLTNYGSTSTGTGNFGSRVMTIGSGRGFFSGRLYGLILRMTLSTDAERNNGEAWCRTAGGVLDYDYVPATFTDSLAPSQQAVYIHTSAYASMDFTTEATLVEVVSYNTVYASIPSLARIGVVVDNVYFGEAAASAAGTTITRFTLPAGSKTVSFVAGFQGYASPATGTFLAKVRANAAMTQVNLTPTNRIAVYGDSIAVGAYADPVHEDAWAIQVRRAYSPDSVVIEAQGNRSLHDDCNTAGLRAAFVAKIVALAPARIWLAIGTNDYGLNKWSAASFGTAYAALLDDLHTALPSATIWAQTPLLRTTETANGSGSTLGDYRTQITTAVSTRTAYCTLVDGTAIMTTASLTDGVHPSSAGHTLYADAVMTALGI